MASTSAKKSAPSLSSFLDKKDDRDKGVENQPVEESNENTSVNEDNFETDNNAETDKNTEVKEKEYPTVEKEGPFLSDQVVGTVPNKTPAELSAETPDETASRYGIDQSITKEDADNPRVQAYRDTHVNQVPSGTHLHPDIAKDLLNRGISEQHTDNAQVKRTVTEYYDFAPDAEHNDKFEKTVDDEYRDSVGPEDSSRDDVPPNAGSRS